MHNLRYLLIIAVVAACSSESQKTQHAFQVIEEDGVPVAVTTGGPLYDEPLFRFEPVLRITQSADVAASVLNNPSDFAPGPNGMLIVVDRRAYHAVMYDSHGMYVREIGTEGAGPGEFRSIQNLQVIGDTLSFYDNMQFRLSVFDMNGHLIEVIPTHEYGRRLGIDVLPRGLLALYRNPAHMTDGFSYRAEEVMVLRMVTGDTLTSLGTEYVKTGKTKTFMTAVGIPFASDPIARVVCGDHIVMTPGDIPEIGLFNLRGQAIRRIRLDLPPRRVTQAMEESYWQAESDRLAQFGRTVNPKTKAEKYFPEKAGWWDGVIADDAGYLWMEDSISHTLSNQPSHYFIINPEGRYIGNIFLPSRTGRIKNGLFYGIVSDAETNELIPTVYRIVPIVEGLKYP